VPDDAPSVPLEVDLRAQARSLRLKIDPLEKAITLDLRKDTDRAKSVFLHRLVGLGIEWGTAREDEVRAMGTFRETWTLRWRPELAVSIVDGALWGPTVRDAADAKLRDLARSAEDLRSLTEALEHALLADLPDTLPATLALLESKAAVDLDVVRLLAAIPALVRAVRYGDVRNTDTRAMAAVIDTLVLRACAGLPASVTSLDDDAAALHRTHIDQVHQALAVHARTPAGENSRTRWIATLAQLAQRRDLHGMLAGRLVRLLLDAGELPREEASRRFAARLSIGVAPGDKAAWAEGFLGGSGLLLVHDPQLLTVLDAWVVSLGEQDFRDVLPLLRRTFGEFSAAERQNIADQLKHLASGTPRPVDVDAIDPERAAGVLRTVAEILAGSGR
jgi:hypothetical protein